VKDVKKRKIEMKKNATKKFFLNEKKTNRNHSLLSLAFCLLSFQRHAR